MVDIAANSPNGRSRKRSRTTVAAPGHRNPRLRLACLRCQRRKIKCGGELPNCKNCVNARAECVDGESARLKDLPRGYIGGLKARVEWLESIVSQRCPDIDLSEGPAAPDGDSPGASHGTHNQGNSAASELSANTSPMQVEATSGVDQQPRPPPPVGGTNPIAHEIGLVSLGTNQDQRYIGPSSGYFLARVMLTKPTTADMREREAPLPSELVEAVQGALPLPSKEMANRLADAYFEYIHPQYPVLHRPSFMSMMEKAYEIEQSDPVILFQVNMVFAVGATVLSGRLKARIPGESYCLTAMKYFERLNVENSLQGVQCLLLLFIFTIHNPYMRLNVWYLNYQCLAALLDIGLQRNITTQSGISLLEQELRARMFWVIFMLDRVVATMMGRPIGVRDEACELRLPQGLDDSVLSATSSGPIGTAPDGISPMAYSVHLFKLAQMNSEIKYVANSVVKGTPSYAYPVIMDINDWQTTMLRQLDQWAADIPTDGSSSLNSHMHLTCQLRYHSLRMVLLRPSPNLPKPSMEALTKCHDSARETLRVMDQMYRKNCLTHSWMTFYSLVLGTITMLYCIKMVPDIARNTRLDVLMMDLGSAMSMLSATGEHWSGAKRSRDILDELGRSTMRWLQDLPDETRATATSDQGDQQQIDMQMHQTAASAGTLQETPMVQGSAAQYMGQDPNMLETGDLYGFMPQAFGDFFPSDNFQFFEPNEPDNVDSIVRNLFQGFIPAQMPAQW